MSVADYSINIKSSGSNGTFEKQYEASKAVPAVRRKSVNYRQTTPFSRTSGHFRNSRNMERQPSVQHVRQIKLHHRNIPCIRHYKLMLTVNTVNNISLERSWNAGRFVVLGILPLLLWDILIIILPDTANCRNNIQRNSVLMISHVGIAFCLIV